MLGGKIPGEFIIPPAADDEFNFILIVDRLQIVHQKCAALSRVRALHVHNFHDPLRQDTDEALTAGFHEHRVILRGETLSQANRVWLQQGLTSG